MRDTENIRYEPGEKSPPAITLNVAFQGSVLALSNTVTVTTIFAVASDGGASYLAWAVFASIVVAGIAAAHMALNLGRIGPGYMLLIGAGSPFVPVCVLAVAEGGLAVMSSLIVAASLVQFALAFWLAQLRRIITPVVSGVSFMIIAVAAMPIAVARLDDVPAGASPIAGMVVGAVTLVAVTILMLRGSGIWRLMAFPLTIVVGCAVAVPLGVYNLRRAFDTPWLGFPEFSAWPGFSPVLDQDFLSLLVVFFVVSAVVAIQTGNAGAAIQQASRRRPRAIDFRGVQGTLNVGGVATLLSGIAGTIPPIIYLPSSIALIGFTGVAARSAAYVMGFMLIALALLPKVVAVLLTIPRPVTGAILLTVMALLFMEGVRTVLQDGLNQQKVLIVGMSLSIAIGLQTQNILAATFGSPWGAAFGNSVVVGILVAVLISVALELTGSRRRRMETELDISALPGVNDFLRGLGSGIGWDEASIDRLCSAGEETLSSMLELREDYEGDGPPRLVIIARPGAGVVELEFLAVFSEENIEDRITYMSDQAETPEVEEISFRLLRHYASSVRHRKYHGIDVVLVRVHA